MVDDQQFLSQPFSGDPAGKRSSRSVPWWVGWGPLLILPTVVLLLAPSNWPRWGVMWLLAFVIFCGCKWLTWRRATIRSSSTTNINRNLGYLLGWPGLDAVSFLETPSSTPVPKPSFSEWLFATFKLIVGLVLLYGLARLVPLQYPYAAGWVGMVGIVFVLHFGTFHLLSCAWRNAGVNAKPLMNWPLKATSLSDFWSRRWNTAFRDLTYRFLFRPLTPRFGGGGAVFIGFVFSGIVHDVVISLPAGGGYGRPTLFFLLQGLGILAERSRMGKAIGLGNGWRGWLFTMATLLLPVGLLFHEPFVVNVVVPFMQAIRAI